jgi:hypothetical protein
MFAHLISLARSLTADRLADASMRFARPIFFILITAMLVGGWFAAADLKTYFEAMSAAPDWLTDIITIFVLGLAVEKSVARPVKEILAGKVK